MLMQPFVHVKVNFKKKIGSTKISPMLDEGVESCSDGKVHVLFTRDLEKVHPCWMSGQEVVPVESIGSIGDEQIPMEKSMIFLLES